MPKDSDAYSLDGDGRGSIERTVEYIEEELKKAHASGMKESREEVIAYIAQHQGWEESEDVYREHYGLLAKYKKPL